ncbi:glycosyltransferase [Clostridium sp. AM51-4]|nr:glycosyltransferase [Clostridium sp. AM51-4]
MPGVGLDIERIESTIVNTNQKKEQLGIQNDEYVLLSVGEMTANKNHELVLRALKKLNNKKIKYLLCGHGEEEKSLKI